MRPLEAALEYAQRGWSVVPAFNMDGPTCACTRLDCPSPGKHPRIAWSQFQKERANPALIRQWWRRWPEANIAIATGAVSGLVVLDIDPRHGGSEAVKDLGPLPPTVTCLTGGGGEHQYYQHPGTPVGNAVGIVPGVDLRGDGGYVIAPPSSHASGRAYEWEVGFGPDEHGIAPAPPGILRPPQGLSMNGHHREGEPIDLNPYIKGEKRLPFGERNVTLTAFTGHLFARGDTPTAVLGTIRLIAMLSEPDEHGALPTLSELEQMVDHVARKEEDKQRARDALASEATMENLETMGVDDRKALARAAWERLGVKTVVDWVRYAGVDGNEYSLELPDRVLNLGPALLNGLAGIRESIVAATGVVIPRMKGDRWDEFAGPLARLAREEYVSAMRESDRVQEWLDEYQREAQDGATEEREAMLRSGPILYDGRLAVRTRRMLIWLEAHFAERLDAKELGRRLTASGWKYQQVRCGDNDRIKVWVSPNLE